MQQKNTDHLRRQRLQLGLTLRALAEKCATEGAPVSNSHLSKIERGLYCPSPRLRAVLAHVLEIDVMDFEPHPDTTGTQPVRTTA
ncbi:MAG TPA: hypothetical protein DEQ61_19965 [Streptomyces sp.]|nr:hypothetical protein [Streptomyces sp.]